MASAKIMLLPLWPLCELQRNITGNYRNLMEGAALAIVATATVSTFPVATAAYLSFETEIQRCCFCLS